MRLLWFCRCWRLEERGAWNLERERSGEGKDYKAKKRELISTKNRAVVKMTKILSKKRTLFETALSMSWVFVQSSERNSSKK